jgi:hypothetical protein
MYEVQKSQQDTLQAAWSVLLCFFAKLLSARALPWKVSSVHVWWLIAQRHLIARASLLHPVMRVLC